MRQTRFTITEDEVRELAEEIDIRDLSDMQIQSILNMVEGDEMLAKDIRSSIKGAILDMED